MAEPTTEVPAPRLELLKALGDNTRYAIYLELARAPRRWPPRRSPTRSGCTPTPCARTSTACARWACSTSSPTPRARSAGRSTATRWPPTRPSLGFEPPAFPVLARMLLHLAATAARPGRRRRRGRPRAGHRRRRRPPGRHLRRGAHPGAGRARASTPSRSSTTTAPPSPSPAARSASWPRPTPTSCAASTGAWWRASSTPVATARWSRSTIWPTARRARSRSRPHAGSLSQSSGPRRRPLP